MTQEPEPKIEREKAPDRLTPIPLADRRRLLSPVEKPEPAAQEIHDWASI